MLQCSDFRVTLHINKPETVFDFSWTGFNTLHLKLMGLIPCWCCQKSGSPRQRITCFYIFFSFSILSYLPREPWSQRGSLKHATQLFYILRQNSWQLISKVSNTTSSINAVIIYGWGFGCQYTTIRIKPKNPKKKFCITRTKPNPIGWFNTIRNLKVSYETNLNQGPK